MELHGVLLFRVEPGLAREAVDDLAAVAAIDRLDEFDRFAGEEVGGAREAKDGGLLADLEEARFVGGSERGLGDFVGEIDLNAIVLREGLVERLAGVEFFLQIGAKAGREMSGLNAERHGIREANAAKKEDFFLRRKMEGFGDIGVRAEAFESQNAGTRAGAASANFFAEGKDLAEVLFELHAGDESAFAALAVGDAEAAEGFEGLAGGHAADAHALGDFLLRGDGLADLERAGANLFEKALLNLIVERQNALPVENFRSHPITRLLRGKQVV